MKAHRERPIIGIPCGLHILPDDNRVEASVILQSYVEAVIGSGGAPMLIPVIDQEIALRCAYEQLDGLLLAGGKADVSPAQYGETPHPACGPADMPRDWVELTLAAWAVAAGMPTLAICRGIQVLNVAAGGSLWQDIPSQVPNGLQHTHQKGDPFDRLSHTVILESNSRIVNILGMREIEVNSLHHQAVNDLGRGLRVTARAPDGIIEGLECKGQGWVVGVQWHPEWLLQSAPHMVLLFDAFVAECNTYGKKTRPG